MEDYDRRMVETMQKEVPLMEGARELIGMFREMGLPLALATCSTRGTHRCGDGEARTPATPLTSWFRRQGIWQGNPTRRSSFTRPNCCRSIPPAAWSFEDSFYGVIAAKAARMKVVAMPDPLEYDQERFGAADLKIRSLTEFTLESLKKLQENSWEEMR